MTTTAIYDDTYSGPVTVKLIPRKTRKGTTFRWQNAQGRTIDGLKPGVYSQAYQVRHAERHARFSHVQEG